MLVSNLMGAIPFLGQARQKGNYYQANLQNRVMKLSLIIFAILTFLPTVAADCSETHRICHEACRKLSGPDPREGGACFIGCELAYLCCKFFTKG